WWKRPSRVAAVCVLLAVIIGDSYERDKLNTRLRYYEKPCLNEWWKFGTSCYYVSSTRDSGREGQRQCKAMGGELVVINSREEQIFIHGLKKNVWIGAYTNDGMWEWLVNTAFKPTYWMEGEPSNLNDEVACIEISQTASDPLKSWKVGYVEFVHRSSGPGEWNCGLVGSNCGLLTQYKGTDGIVPKEQTLPN
ncbi:unnamed protein product, partial [Coregonus sp. 'balchen']